MNPPDHFRKIATAIWVLFSLNLGLFVFAAIQTFKVARQLRCSDLMLLQTILYILIGTLLQGFYFSVYISSIADARDDSY